MRKNGNSGTYMYIHVSIDTDNVNITIHNKMMRVNVVPRFMQWIDKEINVSEFKH